MMDDKFIAEMAAFSDFVKASCKSGLRNLIYSKLHGPFHDSVLNDVELWRLNKAFLIKRAEGLSRELETAPSRLLAAIVRVEFCCRFSALRRIIHHRVLLATGGVGGGGGNGKQLSWNMRLISTKGLLMGFHQAARGLSGKMFVIYYSGAGVSFCLQGKNVYRLVGKGHLW